MIILTYAAMSRHSVISIIMLGCVLWFVFAAVLAIKLGKFIDQADRCSRPAADQLFGFDVPAHIRRS